MNSKVAIGRSNDLDGHTAAQQATHHALDRLGSARIALALVFASQEFSIQSVLAGTTSLLGNTPQWGYSTTTPLYDSGLAERSVVVVLLAGEDLRVQASYWPDYARDTAGTAQRLLQSLPAGINAADQRAAGTLLLAADGISGDADQLSQALAGQVSTLLGVLADGDYHAGRTHQIGGSQSGSGGLAAAFLNDRLRVGVGSGHGWMPVGPYFKVSRSLGTWVRLLDAQPAAEVYSQHFGFTARDWALPPLTDMIRLYPLGIETEQGELAVRAPLHVEADGSFRMNVPIPEGSMAHLMIGRVEACLSAARQAAEQALANLGSAKPLVALVFADLAWQRLLGTQAGQELAQIQPVLPGVPLVGGYTLGQIAGQPANLMNQHIVVAVFGEDS